MNTQAASMKPSNQLSRELSLRPFLQRSNYAAVWLILFKYALIFIAFVLPIVMPHWWVFLIGLILLANGYVPRLF